MPTLKIIQNGKWVHLPYIIKIIQNGEWIHLPYMIKIIQNEPSSLNTVGEIEELIVSYFENKTVGEVEE